MQEKNPAPESLARRIADQRAELGWTQQDLADRLGISRVAVSHLEAGMSQPGERTVALLAGVFKLEPRQLVAGTDYPPAKSERLPLVAARYTEVEHQLILLGRDIEWLEGDDPEARRDRTLRVLAEWADRLVGLGATAHDEREVQAVSEAADRVRRLRSALDHN
jgi:transcriptional regulator with XRE-family HTH domain